MGEIEIGEYYRTKNGLIRKVETVKSGKRQFTRTTETLINGRHKLEDIVKHSKNIIDLIEVGDYVNGYKVDDIEKFEDGTIYIEFNKYDYISDIEEYKIKSIVTKEMMKSIEYRLED